MTVKTCKFIDMILIIALIIGLTAGCTQNETTTAPYISTTIVPTTNESKNAANQSGNANTNLNVFNYGMVCSKDDWVYYSDLTEMKLYKVDVGLPVK